MVLVVLDLHIEKDINEHKKYQYISPYKSYHCFVHSLEIYLVLRAARWEVETPSVGTHLVRLLF
jgi:hypothetical protein